MKVLAAIATFNRLETTQRFWDSFVATTTPDEVEVGFCDNGSKDGTAEWVLALQDPRVKYKYFHSNNRGTATAINRVWRERIPNQPCLKVDDDVTFGTCGWLTRMQKVFELLPAIGCVGLKRKDLAERCTHPRDSVQVAAPWYKSQLFELSNREIIETVNHAMGTCLLFAPAALEKVGDLYQMQDEGNVYGFDDSIMAARLRLTGFDCCFLRGIEIEHFDLGAGGGERNAGYTNWKREQAGRWMKRYSEIILELKQGHRPPFWRDSLES